MNSLTHTFFSIITDIGDSASLLTLAVASSIYLIARGSKRSAAFLLTSFLFSVALISFLKFAFLGCRTYFHQFNIHSPSGHAAMSAATFWAFAILMRSQLDAARRFLPFLLLTLLIAAIGLSRVYLGYHSAAEVGTGLIAGLISLALAYFFIMRKKFVAPFDAYALALWGVIAIFVAHGARLPGEDMVHWLVYHIHGHVPFCG